MKTFPRGAGKLYWVAILFSSFLGASEPSINVVRNAGGGDGGTSDARIKVLSKDVLRKEAPAKEKVSEITIEVIPKKGGVTYSSLYVVDPDNNYLAEAKLLMKSEGEKFSTTFRIKSTHLEHSAVKIRFSSGETRTVLLALR